jgi:hypothetical protein
MFRGLLVFGLATCVIGAPVATDLCQAECATRSTDAASEPAGAEHHSCHAEAPPSGPALTTVHTCGHTNELPGVDRPEQVTVALAILPTMAIVVPAIEFVPASVTPVQASPPLLVALTSLLRV